MQQTLANPRAQGVEPHEGLQNASPSVLTVSARGAVGHTPARGGRVNGEEERHAALHRWGENDTSWQPDTVLWQDAIPYY